MNHLHNGHVGFPDNGQHPNPPGNVDDDGDDPTRIFSGHVFTTAMPLWSSMKEHPAEHMDTSTSESRSVINSLIQSSSHLGLETEVPPVQVLAMIREKGKQEGGVKTETLRKLTEALGGHVTCYGYVIVAL
jgi:hypothetical protein